jgi:hypothetical protein
VPDRPGGYTLQAIKRQGALSHTDTIGLPRPKPTEPSYPRGKEGLVESLVITSVQGPQERLNQEIHIRPNVAGVSHAQDSVIALI